MLKKLFASLVGALLAATLLATPVSADEPANVVDAVIDASGGPGDFDRNGRDFDILREAALAVTAPDGTPVATILATTGDITVWAPRDFAFFRLAKDLGYRGGYDEAAFGTFLLTNVPNDALFQVLAYHVTPGSLNVFEVFAQSSYPTLQGETIERFLWFLVDEDTDDRDARVAFPLNIETENDSIIHTVDRVLRPFDLP